MYYILIISLFFVVNSAYAADKMGSSLRTPVMSQEEAELPDGLDFERRKASLRRFQLSPYGGDMFGDKLSHSYVVGQNVQFNLTPMLALSADFAYSDASAPTGPLAVSFTTDDQFFMDGGFVITVPALYRSGKGAVEADFFTSIGAGVVNTNSANRFGGYLGGGMLIRPNIEWLAIRVEIRDYFTSIPNPAGSDFENQLHIRVGPTFILPPDL